MHEVIVYPHGLRLKAEPGAALSDLLEASGITIDMPCGGEGVCGKCHARIRDIDQPEEKTRDAFVCQTTIDGPLVVEIPETSLLSSSIRVVTDVTFSTGSAPEIDTDIQDGAPFGVAVDIGTTTLAAELVDLSKGQAIAVASRMNPQTAFGDDVISRIQHAITAENGRDALQSRIVDAIDEMIVEMCDKTGKPSTSIGRIVAAGNTTMQHLFTRLDPTCLGGLPFQPATPDAMTLPAEGLLKTPLAPEATVNVFPVIGGFIGGDTVACILCRELLAEHESEDLELVEGSTLLIDIGTNGEIVLFHEGRRWATAAAAGPAFEGARILHGMRAVDGAIEKAVYDPELQDLHLETINAAPIRGICGSGLLDIAAELLRLGLLEQSGRLLTKDDAQRGDFSEQILSRLVEHDGKAAVRLSPLPTSDEDADERPVVLTQQDLRELQLASGAIRTGCLVLLAKAGIEPRDLTHLYLAGGFGQHIRRRNAQRLGLLPTDIPLERIRFLGNTALAGARSALCSRRLWKSLETLARETEQVDLSAAPDFQSIFAMSMLFPESS
jgi:uncharacterized 2Fe-2S/4Fe-4S cluster protein (DUF4445 family)